MFGVVVKKGIDALKAAGHEIWDYDPADGYGGLDKFVGKMDCVFPILHGEGGEDGAIQQELDKRRFKYLGSDAKISRLCFNKNKLKELLNKSSILTPRWEVVDREGVKRSILIRAPYVLKPIGGGSTIDAYIVRDPNKMKFDESVFDRHGKMLLEELIEGNEITVSILGNKALPVIELFSFRRDNFNNG